MNAYRIAILNIFGIRKYNEDYFYENIPSEDIHEVAEDFISFSVSVVNSSEEYFSVILQLKLEEDGRWCAYYNVDTDVKMQDDVIIDAIQEKFPPTENQSNVFLYSYSIIAVMDKLKEVYGALDGITI